MEEILTKVSEFVQCDGGYDELRDRMMAIASELEPPQIEIIQNYMTASLNPEQMRAIVISFRNKEIPILDSEFLKLVQKCLFSWDKLLVQSATFYLFSSEGELGVNVDNAPCVDLIKSAIDITVKNWRGHEPTIASKTISNKDWWLIHEKVITLQDDYSDFEWYLDYKPGHRYLSNKGSKLGTTHWYIKMQIGGGIFYCVGDRPSDVVYAAVEKAIAELNNYLELTEKNKQVDGFRVKEWKELYYKLLKINKLLE